MEFQKQNPPQEGNEEKYQNDNWAAEIESNSSGKKEGF